MPHFSDTLRDDQKKSHDYEIPVWLRILFVREVLSYFYVLTKDKSHHTLISIPYLHDSVLVHYKLQDEITDLPRFLRSCQWYEFLDFIELFADELLRAEDECEKEINNTPEPAIDSEEYNDYCLGMMEDKTYLGFRALSYGSYEYIARINAFFSSYLSKYGFNNTGRIFLVEDNPTLRKELDNNFPSIKTVQPRTEIEWILENIDNSLINEQDRNSLSKASDLFYQANFRECLCILVVVLESIANILVINQGKKPEDFLGLTKKMEFLEKAEILPNGLKNYFQVVYLRNKFIHEHDFLPDNELLEVECRATFLYIKNLLIVSK